MALFIARWPDGSAWLVDAESMAEVANILDEVSDPGACEVQPYEGPFAVELRPAKRREDEAIFDFRETAAADTTSEMQGAILKAAYPRLHAALERARRE